jgi:hypothetical protein
VFETPVVQPQQAAPEVAPRPPLARRVADLVLAPGRLAQSLAFPGSPWFDALALVVLIGMLAVFAVPDEFYLEQVREAVDRRGRPVEITSDPAAIARWGRALSMFTALAQWPLLVIAVTALVSLVLKTVAGGGAGFRQYLPLGVHASLLLSLQQLVVLAGSWLAGAEVSTSIASLLRLEADGFAVAFLDLVDPFTIWMLVVFAIGAATYNRGLGVLRPAAVLITGYLALAAALAAVAG